MFLYSYPVIAVCFELMFALTHEDNTNERIDNAKGNAKLEETILNKDFAESLSLILFLVSSKNATYYLSLPKKASMSRRIFEFFSIFVLS